VAPLVAAHLKAVTGVAVINANFSPLPDLLAEQLLRIATVQLPHVLELQATLERARSDARPPPSDPLALYFWNAWRYRPEEALAQWPLGLLVLACDRDAHVAKSEADAWYAAALRRGLTAEVRRYAELDHLAMPARGDALIDIAAPGEVDGRVVADLARWLEGPS
jgi:hypothetical protein